MAGHGERKRGRPLPGPPIILGVDVGHKLKLLPANNIKWFKDMDLQCVKCGCVFRININDKMADFLLNCKLERDLRDRDPANATERPILVKED